MTMNERARSMLGRWIEGGAGLRAALEAGPDGRWAEARATYLDTLAALFPAPDDIAVAADDLGGVPTTVVSPNALAPDSGASRPAPTLLYLHGGGYASSGPRAYHGLAGRLALGLGARAFIPDYRLAPEHRFPAAIDDNVAAYRALLDRDHDPRTVALAGDSAGGAMVVTVMRRVRDAGLPLPAAAVAISPWADLTHDGASARERDGLDPLCSIDFLRRLARNVLGDALPTDPDASPVFADLRRLAPTLILAGENEVMLSDALTLAARLAEHRTRIALEVWPGMFHVWPLFAGVLPEADEAIGRAVDFIRAAFDRATAQ